MGIERIGASNDLLKGLAGSPSGGGEDQGFGEMLKGIVSKADGSIKETDRLAQSMASGQPTEVHEVILAMTEADAAFRTMLEVRNRLVEAYQEMQRMPV